MKEGDITMNYRKYRLLANLTQQELADLSGTTKQHISQIENLKKQPSVNLLIHISIILGVCINQLVGIGCIHINKPSCPFKILIFICYII